MFRKLLTCTALLAILGAGAWGAWRIWGPSPDQSSQASGAGELETAGIQAAAAGPLAIRKRPSGPGMFTDMIGKSGVGFVHVSGEAPEKPFPTANGSGLAILDFDRDGWRDLYFATGDKFPLDNSRSEPINRFYRALGDWKFAEVTAATGTARNGYTAGLAVGDYDSDGFPDLFVSCVEADCLLHNRGDGTFERVENEAGVADPRWGASAAFLDFDEDGLLDLYVCNYAKWTWETNKYCGDHLRGIRFHCGPRSVEPEPHVLYRNAGDGRFLPATDAAGVGKRLARGQGVVAADLNTDGHVDLYVGNDQNPNFLFYNQGDGAFLDLTDTSGAAFDSLGKEQAGMGVDAADINGDGRPELFVTNFAHEYNTLYENQGDGYYNDVSNRYGLAPHSLPYVGWGTAFRDFDLDGKFDLIVTNGNVDNNRHLIIATATHEEPPLLYRGAGNKFIYISDKGGDYFQQSHVGRGLATADLDNDGDEDVVIVHQDGPPALLRNNRLSPGGDRKSSITLRLVGVQGNRDAIGASVTLAAGGVERLHLVKGGGSYLSASDVRLVCGLGAMDGAMQSIDVHILWPGGRTSQIAGLQPGKNYVIFENGDQPPLVADSPLSESPP